CNTSGHRRCRRGLPRPWCRPRAAKTAPRSAARPRAGRATRRGSSPAARAGRMPPSRFAAPFGRATASGTRPRTEALPARRFAWVEYIPSIGAAEHGGVRGRHSLARPVALQHFHGVLRSKATNRRSIAVHGRPHLGARMQGTLQTTTTFSIEGYRITEYKGLVRGIVVRSPTIGQ